MVGRVRTFIRLAGCNLACRWCDTAYTWNWIGAGHAHERDRPGRRHQFDPAREMRKLAVEDAAERVLALAAPGVVVTGGEPMLQRDALLALGRRLKEAKPTLRLEMETNGTLTPSLELAALFDLFVVSPKLGHSGNSAERALPRLSLETFAGFEQAVFKLVAQSREDVAEAASLMQSLGVAADRVWIMPKGATPAELQTHVEAIWPSVLDRGFQLSERGHIRLFGNRRGA